MKKFTISTLLIVLFLFLDAFFSKYTFSFSNRITIYLQHLFEYGNQEGIFESINLIFTRVGDSLVANTLEILIWFKAENKQQILKLYTMSALASAIGNIVKMVQGQPRPFYLNENIQLDFCCTGYGDPSGHSLRPVVFYVILLEIIILQKYNKSKGQQQIQLEETSRTDIKIQTPSNYEIYKSLYPNSNISYNQCKFFIGLFGFIVGITRMYFGVHFLSQVIVGWGLLAYILYLYYKCGLEQLLDKLFDSALKIKNELVSKQILFYFKFGSFLLIVYISSFILAITRHYNDQLTQQKEDWWYNFVNKQPTCAGNGHQGYLENFEISDVYYITIIFFPLFLLTLYNNQVADQNVTLKSRFCKENVIKVISLVIFFIITLKKNYFINYIEEGILKHIAEHLFEILHYFNQALFFLVLGPIIQDLINYLIRKYKTPPNSTQISTTDLELVN